MLGHHNVISNMKKLHKHEYHSQLNKHTHILSWDTKKSNRLTHTFLKNHVTNTNIIYDKTKSSWSNKFLPNFPLKSHYTQISNKYNLRSVSQEFNKHVIISKL